MRPILHGLGNFDRFTADAWEGCTLRLFDPGTREWSIHRVMRLTRSS